MAGKKTKENEVELPQGAGTNRLDSELYLGLLKQIQKKHGTSMLLKASDNRASENKKLITGILPLDYALGGGFPAGRINILAGMQSSMKTSLVLRTIAIAQQYCSLCGIHRNDHHADEVVCKSFNEVTACLIEPEGTFDAVWAKALGVNLDTLVYSQPALGEDAIDLFDSLVRSGSIDIAVLDSLACLIPGKVVEKSAGDAIVGAQAMLINRLVDKTTNALNECGSMFGKRPTVFWTNQMRQKITMFGDPNVMRGGMASPFAASTILKLTAQKPETDEHENPVYMPIGFKVDKNKVAVAKMEGSFKLVVADTETKKKGQIYDEDKIVELAEFAGLYKKEGAQWMFEGEALGTAKSVFERKLLLEPDYSANVRKLLMDRLLNPPAKTNG